MNKEVKEKDKRVKTSLFFKIILRLSLPLFLLGVIFTAIQLTNRIGILNELRQIETRFAIDAIKRELDQARTVPADAQGLIEFRQLLDNTASDFRADRIDIYDPLERRSVIAGDGSKWTEKDAEAIQETLLKHAKGTPYLIRTDPAARKFIAFIPLDNLQGSTGIALVLRATFSLNRAQRALSDAHKTLFTIFICVLITGLIIGYSLSRSILRPIQQLNAATNAIMRGNLGEHVKIKTGDEIQMLAETFNQMSDTLKRMREQAEDANPLTGLPGNRAIYDELHRRILEGHKFVFFHVDIDRFKIYNDHFGLARGDVAIKKTAEVIKKAVKEKGTEKDFIGHQGGDDFVIITTPARAKELGEYVCRLFDADVRNALYRKPDLDAGHTVHLDRRHLNETGEQLMRKFPLMSISLAGVSNAKRDFADYFACMNASVEVKKEAKSRTESCSIIQE